MPFAVVAAAILGAQAASLTSQSGSDFGSSSKQFFSEVVSFWASRVPSVPSIIRGLALARDRPIG